LNVNVLEGAAHGFAKEEATSGSAVGFGAVFAMFFDVGGIALAILLVVFEVGVSELSN
jgi:hypothetical protein